MCSTSYNLCWESYKNNLCNGFSKLQQHQEFVDVTLAANGHLVKAHQNILALASPYLKQLLQSAPCQHPVIFLSDVSHVVLAHLLEYIYTGEVQVPNHLLPSFSKAARKMHLVGLENMTVPPFLGDMRELELNPTHPPTSINTNEEKTEHIRPKSFAAHITIGGENGEFVVQPSTDSRNDFDAIENNFTNHTAYMNDPQFEGTKENEEIFDNHSSLQMFSATNVNMLNQIALVNDNCNAPDLEHTSENETNCEQTTTQKIHINTKEIIPPPLYTTSNRGCLQMIYNRFIYNMHYSSFGGKKRRWRCINYRKIRCPAYIDTEEELIVCRKKSHNHGFHDNQFISKARRNDVCTSITQACKRIAEKEAKKIKTITGTEIEEYFDKDVELPLADEN